MIWFEPRREPLGRPYRFMANLMTNGTIEDLGAVREAVTEQEFKEALENAPPGFVDARSLAYWNLICGIQPALPMPKREL